jgi:hypothetical protein
LLHGFGFAGALNEIGLPESDVPTALLTFNLGVEAGQIVIVRDYRSPGLAVGPGFAAAARTRHPLGRLWHRHGVGLLVYRAQLRMI